MTASYDKGTDKIYEL